ncbi:MAG: homoserine dehydrogenase [Sandaracinaceae bacterium]|nr:homoserine dehydrogenase [Sandaracinaceae bacterium]
MTKSIGIGLVGCGVVGTGLLQVLQENATAIEGRLGVPLEVRRIAVRDPAAVRSPLVPQDKLTADPMELVRDPDIQVIVEVMGGVERAYEVVHAAILAGKHVVTANKALLAERGAEIWNLAEQHGVDVYYEAAVAGGIPVIRVLREALASERVLAIRGIVNGTSNYILSRMSAESMSFADALAEAQAAGYAEADPTLDVGGGDACHKIAILATLAFGQRVPADQIPTEGIDRVATIDIAFAQRLGFVIKPLAVARVVGDSLDLRVHPALVPVEATLATVHGALNAVAIEGALLGPILMSGPGAGAGPTATSVAGDLLDVARNIECCAHARVPSRGFRQVALRDAKLRDIGEHRGRFYLRLTVADRPGVLGAITSALGDNDVSIEQMFQDGGGQRSKRDETGPVSVVLLTHRATERNVRAALASIETHDAVVAPSQLIRIEE